MHNIGAAGNRDKLEQLKQRTMMDGIKELIQMLKSWTDISIEYGLHPFLIGPLLR
jgi:hypothetical protein